LRLDINLLAVPLRPRLWSAVEEKFLLFVFPSVAGFSALFTGLEEPETLMSERGEVHETPTPQSRENKQKKGKFLVLCARQVRPLRKKNHVDVAIVIRCTFPWVQGSVLCAPDHLLQLRRACCSLSGLVRGAQRNQEERFPFLLLYAHCCTPALKLLYQCSGSRGGAIGEL
jgi:hypothetical protein